MARLSIYGVELRKNDIPEKVRARALARVYAEILTWPDPREEKTEPAADDLGRNTAASSAGTPRPIDPEIEETGHKGLYAPFVAKNENPADDTAGSLGKDKAIL